MDKHTPRLAAISGGPQEGLIVTLVEKLGNQYLVETVDPRNDGPVSLLNLRWMWCGCVRELAPLERLAAEAL